MLNLTVVGLFFICRLLFAFVHYNLAVGNATHPGSRGNRRRREASDHLTNGYSLAEDLSHLTRRKREGKREKDLDKSDM